MVGVEAASPAVITDDRIESWPATATRSPSLLSQDKNLQWVYQRSTFDREYVRSLDSIEDLAGCWRTLSRQRQKP